MKAKAQAEGAAQAKANAEPADLMQDKIDKHDAVAMEEVQQHCDQEFFILI